MDNSEIKHQRDLLTIYRRNLAHYQRQADAYGGLEFAPPITRHGINEANARIAEIEARLRAAGVEV